MSEFLSGQTLSQTFYTQTVHPLLDQHFPDLPHAAAHLGSGSDVLGFDDPTSRDHDWGPSVYLLLPAQHMMHAETVRETIIEHLPRTVCGHPTRIQGRYRLYVTTVEAYLWRLLQWNVETALKPADWLSFPSQLLRVIQAGAVHHDGAGKWTKVRERLRWYPHDVWLYLMAASWQRIGQEDHLHGRAGQVGDELGSALIASRLMRDIMQLCFLQERVYAPYPKWFGTGFQKLQSAEMLQPILKDAQMAATWQARETALVAGFEFVARQHNALNVTGPIDSEAKMFHERPFRVMSNNGIVEVLLDAIEDPAVKRLKDLPGLIGGIDHFSDSTDLRSQIGWRERVRALYAPLK